MVGSGADFKPAQRWWGKGVDGSILEMDVMAELSEGKYILAGESKWTDKVDTKAELAILERKVKNLPFFKGHKIILALFLKHKQGSASYGPMIFGPEDVIPTLK